MLARPRWLPEYLWIVFSCVGPEWNVHKQDDVAYCLEQHFLAVILMHCRRWKFPSSPIQVLSFISIFHIQDHIQRFFSISLYGYVCNTVESPFNHVINLVTLATLSPPLLSPPLGIPYPPSYNVAKNLIIKTFLSHGGKVVLYF